MLRWIELLCAKRYSRGLQICLDLLVLALAFVLSYLLRFDFTLSTRSITAMKVQLPFVLLVQFLTMSAFRVHSYIWRYVGLREARVFLLLTTCQFIPLMGVRLFFPESLQSFRVPISIIVIHSILSFCAVFGIRVLRRMMFENFQKNRCHSQDSQSSYNNQETETKRVLLIGAGAAGLLASKEIQKHNSGLDIIGFVDDDASKMGTVVNGIKVRGNSSQLAELASKHQIDHVIITISQTSKKQIQRIVKQCEAVPLKVKIIPGYFDLLEGKVEINRIRDVDIEDLLGRNRVMLNDQDTAAFLKNKRVMITGAGGSIGSELVRQVCKHLPEKVLMVERSEFALYTINREINGGGKKPFPCLPIIADICDTERVESIMRRFQPHIILHAAAHKHVPMMEFNPAEAIKNNSIGTWHLGDIAGRNGVEAFVLISTDKAVNSSSVMGASKRCAELFIQALDARHDTKFLAVRFGNVLGSTGSVIPLFREQIRRGGPVTVTHPDMTRYFMTIPEATQLVLKASAMGNGSEIFILDMGEPVKIVDLAEQMIRLSGLTVGEDIKIAFTGLRPGEKMFEELNTREDKVNKTLHPKIFIGKIKSYTPDHVNEMIHDLMELSSNGHESELREYISNILPEASISRIQPDH